MKNFLSYFFPQTLLKTSSQWNRQIRVNLEQGEPKLLVNGSRQSGAYIRGLWENALMYFPVTRLSPERILVLGVGGGTVIKLLTNKYPGNQITGVDVDPRIIDIGKKYFGLEKLVNLRLVECEAQKYMIREIKAKKHSDLIVVDIFLGSDVPDFVVSPEFMKICRQLLSSSGALLINYLREKDYWQKAQKFTTLLRQVFTDVQSFEIANNVFFFCS